MKIESLDHLVLTVANLAKTVKYYQEVLGMEAVTFGEGRQALHFGEQKINLHQAGKEFDPKAPQPPPGSADRCFSTALPREQGVEHLKTCQVAIEEGPVPRTGARGSMNSVYLRDPDGNLIEISIYLPGDDN